MNTFIKSMNKLFISLQAHPEKSDEIAEMIKCTLNDSFNQITCKKVFISKGNDCDPYGITVIPNMPRCNILTVNSISEYDIDIDLDSFINKHNKNGFDSEELIAWLLHELYANVMTDETLLRYKKLLIKYYDTNNSSIMDTVRSLGRLLWIGIFSRTKKEYINEDADMSSMSLVNMTLFTNELADSWNSALAKYVCNNDASYNILTDKYIDRMDRTQLREFNTLARKYSSYVLKYNNTDYSTMIKYIINTSNSELIKHYCEKEPDQMIIFKERDVYNIFNDRKLLLENADQTRANISLMKNISAAELQNMYTEYEIDINNVETASDKILLAVKLKDLITKLSEKILETELSDKEILSLLREKSMMLLDKLNKIDVDKQLTITELNVSAF